MSERAEHIASSVATALAGRHVEEDDRKRVTKALEVAMRLRVERLTDDHHPAYLHPGRSVLILLHDVQELEAGALTLTAIHESCDPELRVPVERVAEEVGPDVAAARSAIPQPGSDDLAERLVLLDREAALAALAERLDQLRHLHLRSDLTASWQATHAEVDAVWLPFAGRIDPRLTTRYAHWLRSFGRRL